VQGHCAANSQTIFAATSAPVLELLPLNFAVEVIGSRERIESLLPILTRGVASNAHMSSVERFQYFENLETYTTRTGGFDNEEYKTNYAGSQLHIRRLYKVVLENSEFSGLQVTGGRIFDRSSAPHYKDSIDCMKSVSQLK